MSEKNDSLANVNAAIGLIISQVPYLGAAYNAIASAHTEKRIEKLEQKYMDLVHSIQELANELTEHQNEHDKKDIEKNLEKMKQPVVVATAKKKTKKA